MPVAEERGVAKAQAKVCPCEACKKGRGVPSKVAPLSIHSYSSQPSGGWSKQQASTEMVTPSLFMGVELETTVRSSGDDIQYNAISREVRRLHPDLVRPANLVGNRYDSYGNITPEWSAWARQQTELDNARYRTEQRLWAEGFGRAMPTGMSIVATPEEAVSMAEPVGFWHAKHDGSVSGPEFASLPASMEYWYSIRNDLEMMFTALLHAGVRSHVGDEAGMHISISLEAFTDSDHLMRFASLVNHNPRWAQRMSQRTAHSMHWCQLGTGSFSPGQESRLRRWAERVMTQGYVMNEDRYCALNAQCGEQGRLEFRLPRGTLRIERFYKNLEWVAAMIEFTANFAATDSATFMRWVMAQGSRFSDLQGWFIEKFRLASVSEPFEPARAVASSASVPNGIASRVSQYGYGRCSCGDGCPEGDCDSCNDRYFDDEEEREYPCACGEDHDRPEMDYQPWNGTVTPNGIIHTHFYSGNFIGLVREFRPDGTEYEYDANGIAIRSEDDLRAEDARSQTWRYQFAESLRNNITAAEPLSGAPDVVFVSLSSFVDES